MSVNSGSDRKHDRDSAGETPKPDSKHNKMAENSSTSAAAPAKGTIEFVSQQIETLMSNVSDVKKNQESMQRMFERKLDRMKNDLMANIDEKVNALRQELTLDLGRETRRIDDIVNDVRVIQQRLNTADGDDSQALGAAPSTMNNGWSRPMNPLDNNEVTVIAFNIPFTDDEDLMWKARDIVSTV